MNERDVLEVLMNDNYFKTTFGALEYDPEVFITTQENHIPDYDE